MAWIKDDFERPSAAMRKFKVSYDTQPLLGAQSKLVDSESLTFSLKDILVPAYAYSVFKVAQLYDSFWCIGQPSMRYKVDVLLSMVFCGVLSFMIRTFGMDKSKRSNVRRITIWLGSHDGNLES